MTRAPRATASWMAVDPIPLVPPWTSSHSPAASRPRSKTFVQTVKYVSGMRRRLASEQPARHRQALHARRRRTARRSRRPQGARTPRRRSATRVPTPTAASPGPERHDRPRRLRGQEDPTSPAAADTDPCAASGPAGSRPPRRRSIEHLAGRRAQDLDGRRDAARRAAPGVEISTAFIR